MQPSMLIVGGGIAGIVAALRAREQGWAVTLIERQPALGGLLRSSQPEGSGHSFDYGTHIPAATGEPDLDAALFGGLPDDQWHVFPAPHAGTFWNGKLSADSACLDLRSLPPETYAQVLTEMLERAPVPARIFGTLAEQIAALYGPRLLAAVFEPALKKLYGVGAVELAPDAHRLFGLIRFICLDPVASRELKRHPVLDGKIALHDFREISPGVASLPGRYPRTGGVGRWIDHLVGKLTAAGVVVRTNVALTRLDLAAGIATTGSGEELAFERIGWSLPPAQLLRLTGHPAALTLAAPRLVGATLHHFITEAAPVPRSHYVTCYDPALRAFRVTLYDNLQPGGTGPSRLTVEVLSSTATAAIPTAAEVFAELSVMGVLPSDAGCLRSFTQELGPAFPLQTPSYREATQRAVDLVAADLPQAFLLGRAMGQGFFMRDVLLDGWRTVAKLTAAMPVG